MTYMKPLPNKLTKQEFQKGLHVTVPPRLEGAVKNAMMDPVRKPKTPHGAQRQSRKMQGHTKQQRKDFQLGSKRYL